MIDYRSENRFGLLASVIGLTLTLTSCGFGQIGPETLIVADTPCGRVEYHSTKDQSAPAAACEADGYKLRIGSDNASGLGALAEAWAKAFVAAAGMAK